jgi:hypothetical protein
VFIRGENIMSHHETATPSPRIAITPATSAAPPWTGVKFTCAKCTAEWQLEAADRCGAIEGGEQLIAPRCPTPGCGHVNIINGRAKEEPSAISK